MSRRTDLENLLAVNGDLAELAAKVQVHPWDIHEELVELTPDHIINILTRFLEHKLTVDDLIIWANAIESREDIATMGDRSADLIQAIHDLANPGLGYDLTRASAKRMINLMRQCPPPPQEP